MVGLNAITKYIPAQAIILPALVFLVMPAYLVQENLTELGAVDPRFLLTLLVPAVGTIVVISFGIGVLKRWKSHRMMLGIMNFLIYFIIFSGFLFPVSTGAGMIDPGYLETDFFNLSICFLLAVGLMVLAPSAAGPAIRIFLILYVVLNFGASAWRIHDNFQQISHKESLSLLSISKNLLVLSLDGISGPAAVSVLKDDPALQTAFAGFTVFDKVAGTSPGTSASTATNLYGNRDFKADFETADQLWAADPEQLLTNLLDREGYEVSTYGVYNHGFGTEQRLHRSTIPQVPAALTNLLSYSMARTMTPILALRGEAEQHLKSMLSAFWTVPEHVNPRLIENITNSLGPEWKRALSYSGVDFHAYVAGLHRANPAPVAQFLHFTHTHFPVELDRQCRYKGHIPEWYEANQNWQGSRNLETCALTQFSQVLAKLRELGVFENSLVVLKSDHGRPVAYHPEDSLYAAKIRGHSLWGIGRYAPFLAIKPFGPGSGKLQFRSDPVLLDDLARTLCQASGIETDCDQYPGFNLLNPSHDEIESAPATFYVVKSAGSTYRYDTHEAITLHRGKDILESLHTALTDEKLMRSLPCPVQIVVKDFETLDNGYWDRSSWVTWQGTDSAHLQFRPAPSCPILQIDVNVGDAATKELQVRINGQLSLETMVLPVANGAASIRLELSEAELAENVIVELEAQDREGSTALEITQFALTTR